MIIPSTSSTLEASLDQQEDMGSLESPFLQFQNYPSIISTYIYLTPFKIHGLPFPFSPSPLEYICMYVLSLGLRGFFPVYSIVYIKTT